MEKTKYTLIYKLRDQLKKMSIPFDEAEALGGLVIHYPNSSNLICSAIEHCGSYGNTQDLIEIMGLLTEEEIKEDEVAGFLEWADVFERIKKDWVANKGEYYEKLL